MESSKNYFLFISLFLLQVSAIAQTGLFETDQIPGQLPQNLDIYLVIGQSNMAGRATVRQEDSVSVKGCYLFTGDSKTPWVIATNPLNRYSTIRKEMDMQRLGPSFEFARSMVSGHSKNEIGLVVNAKGGTKITQWLPDTEFYNEAIKQTHKALKFGALKGIIWHQGEGDSNPDGVEKYLGRLEILINAIRKEFGDPTIPFIAGQLYENEKRHAFNEMILQLPDIIRYTGVAISVGTKTSDSTHFDSESAIIMGERYAAQMKKIQSEKSTKK